MTRLVEDKRDEIAGICRRYEVARLQVFGSAAAALRQAQDGGTEPVEGAAGDFDPARSDVDLIVEFHPGVELGPWMARYFDLRRDLQDLLKTSVDLVMAGAVRNPYFAREVERTRALVYAA